MQNRFNAIGLIADTLSRMKSIKAYYGRIGLAALVQMLYKLCTIKKMNVRVMNQYRTANGDVSSLPFSLLFSSVGRQFLPGSLAICKAIKIILSDKKRRSRIMSASSWYEVRLITPFDLLQLTFSVFETLRHSRCWYR
jgi:hypothetical protein